MPREQASKSELVNLIEEGRTREAAQLARILCQQLPEDPECFLFLGIALMNGEKYDKARRTLERALEKFPHEWKLRMVLGHVYGHQHDFPRAEDAYRRALRDATDAPSEEIAELRCSIGEMLWGQHHREEALEEWQEALRIDPDCEEARESLEEFTNEYGEPKAPNPIFDDLYHFQHIQMKRYFALVGHSEFTTKEEATMVLGVIMNGWNTFVTPRSREMDDWTTTEKSKFLAGITLDFKQAVERWRGR